MTIQVEVDLAVKAVCPIDGVSFGKINDKSTWRIDFKDEATDQQRVAAKDAIARFDLAAPALAADPAVVDAATQKFIREEVARQLAAASVK